jgi:hypothetical protein
VTHPRARVEEALRLRSHGLTARVIGERLAVPRGTISSWINGHVPAFRVPGEGQCLTCGDVRHRFGELPDAYVYLLGLYLGDGCIAAHPRGVYRLRVILDSAYPKIIAEASRAMRAVRPISKVGKVKRPGCVEVSSYWKGWPCLFPQHGPGRKHRRRIEFHTWQRELASRMPDLLLRGLIHSDGCRFMNTGSGGWRNPRYSFTNLSEDIRSIFTDACDLMDLRWTSAGRTIYVSRKADVARMDTFIGPKA